MADKKLLVPPFNKDEIKELAVEGVKEAIPFPTDLDNKTYVLKLVDGVLTWVEEVE